MTRAGTTAPPASGRPSRLPLPLLRFLVNLMLVAARTELLPLHALRMGTPVLGGEVVTVFALAARENDFFSWHFFTCSYSELATGIEPVTSPLPRVCSTD